MGRSVIFMNGCTVYTDTTVSPDIATGRYFGTFPWPLAPIVKNKTNMLMMSTGVKVKVRVGIRIGHRCRKRFPFFILIVTFLTL